MSAGAYSQKYQQLERERLRQYQQAKKSSRDRAVLLSKQTSQRQRALEEKKRAMARAEEDRRRKALEDRRKTQQEATERFKSAIVRLRSAPSAQTHSGRAVREAREVYLPSKPKAAVASDNAREQSPSKQAELRHTERVAIGHDVEVTPSGASERIPQRIPSLDDVLRAVRGTDSKSVPSSVSSESRLTSSQAPPTSVLSVRGRSASDTNLAQPLNSSIVAKSSSMPGEVRVQTMTASSTSSNATAKHNVVEGAWGEKGAGAPSVARDDNGPVQYQSVIFHPVPRLGGLEHTLDTAGTDASLRNCTGKHGDVRVMSPDQLGSTSSDDDSDTSARLADSLESAPVTSQSAPSDTPKKAPTAKRDEEVEEVCQWQVATRLPTEGSQSRPHGMASTQPGGSGSARHILVTGSGLHRRQVARMAVRYDVDTDSSSSDEYVSTGRFPPRRRSTRYSAANSMPVDSSRLNVAERVDYGNECAAGQIVGILKKPGSTAQSQLSSKTPSAVATTHASLVGSTVSTATTATQESLQGSSRSKKVRFVDQAPSPITARQNPDSAVSAVLESARRELWKAVLPGSNGLSTHFPPNSAFTPRMRVSLSSSKTPPSPPVHQLSRKTPGASSFTPPSIASTPPPNGITVHMPAVAIDSPRQHVPAHSSDPPSPRTAVDKGDPLTLYKECQTTDVDPPAGISDSSQTTASGSSGKPTSSDDVRSARDCTSETDSQQDGQLCVSPEHRRNGDIPLDRTPSDEDINELWDQIRAYFRGRDKGPVPAQLFKFLPERKTPAAPVKHGHTADEEGEVSRSVHSRDGPPPPQHGSQARVVHRPPSPQVRPAQTTVVHRPLIQRQRSRPMRCQNGLLSHPSPVQLWPSPRAASHPHSLTTPHPHSLTAPHHHSLTGDDRRTSHAPLRCDATHSKGSKVSFVATGKKVGPQASLTVEEQRLMQSIDVLNRRIRDHVNQKDSGSNPG